MSKSSQQARKERRREARRKRAFEDKTPYYLKVGVRQFKTTHESAVEKIAFIHENFINREVNSK
jgi:hypothetical protein